MSYTETEWRERVRQVVENELSGNDSAAEAFAVETGLTVVHNGRRVARPPMDIADYLLTLSPYQLAKTCRIVHMSLCGRENARRAIGVVDVVLLTAIPILWLKSEEELEGKGVTKEILDGIEVMTIRYHLAYASEIVCAYLDRRPARFRKPEKSQDGFGADFRGSPSIVLPESGADLTGKLREIDLARELVHLVEAEFWGWHRSPTQEVRLAWQNDQNGTKWKRFIDRLAGALDLLVTGDVGNHPLRPYVLVSRPEEMAALRRTSSELTRLLKSLRVVRLPPEADVDSNVDSVGTQLSVLFSHSCRE